jgi:formate dehydrogenase subunit gamma
MTDVYKMWEDFKKDPSTYPELAKIKDDNSDHVVEINRPEEIDALILSITMMLTKTKYPMDGKQVVWVMNDKVYESGTKFSLILKEQWEASPYANVHKYSHDVFPARAALGVRGCAQCHSSQAAIFHQDVTVYPFDENARPVMAGNHEILGYSSVSLALMSILQNGIKPISMWAIGILILVLLLHFIIIGPREVGNGVEAEIHLVRYNVNERVVHYAAMVVFVLLGVSGFMTFWSAGFDSDTIGSIYRFHYVVGLFLLVIGAAKLIMWQEHARFEHFDREWLRSFGGYFGSADKLDAGKFNAGQKLFFIFMIASVILLGVTGVVLLTVANSNVRMIVHFVHDVSAIVFTIAIITHAYLGVMANPGSLKAVIRGTVTREWARQHHSKWIDE